MPVDHATSLAAAWVLIAILAVAGRILLLRSAYRTDEQRLALLEKKVRPAIGPDSHPNAWVDGRLGGAKMAFVLDPSISTMLGVTLVVTSTTLIAVLTSLAYVGLFLLVATIVVFGAFVGLLSRYGRTVLVDDNQLLLVRWRIWCFQGPKPAGVQPLTAGLELVDPLGGPPRLRVGDAWLTLARDRRTMLRARRLVSLATPPQQLAA